MTAVYATGERGAREASREGAAVYSGADYRIGERDSAKARGFDFGNSPTEVEAAELAPARGLSLASRTAPG